MRRSAQLSELIHTSASSRGPLDAETVCQLKVDVDPFVCLRFTSFAKLRIVLLLCTSSLSSKHNLCFQDGSCPELLDVSPEWYRSVEGDWTPVINRSLSAALSVFKMSGILFMPSQQIPDDRDPLGSQFSLPPRDPVTFLLGVNIVLAVLFRLSVASIDVTRLECKSTAKNQLLKRIKILEMCSNR